MGRLRLQLPNPGVVGGRTEIVIVLQKRHQMKSAVDNRKIKFRPAGSAAGPKLGDYTQWVRWHAPTERNKNKKKKRTKEKAYPDGCSRRQVCLGTILDHVTLSSQLRVDVQKRLVQRPCAASPHPPMGAALVASASGIAELAVPVSRGRGAEFAFSRRRRVSEPA